MVRYVRQFNPSGVILFAMSVMLIGAGFIGAGFVWQSVPLNW